METTSVKAQREHVRKELAKNEQNADVLRILRAAHKHRPILDRDLLFQLLAMAAVPDPPPYRKGIIRAQDGWRNWAKQLETAAKHGERLVADPLSYPEAHLLPPDSVQGSAAPGFFRLMRIYAEFARLQARFLGGLLRGIGVAAKWHTAILLVWVRAATGKLCENELARLLTEACEIAGTKEEFSGDKLRKQWKRHTFPILSTRDQIARQRQELPAEMAAFRLALLRRLDKSTP